MARGGRIDIDVGFNVDEKGLVKLQSAIQNVARMTPKPGEQMNEGLQKAVSTASTLEGILKKTYNSDLGSLNIIKFNQELSKSGLTLKDLKSNLSGAGNQGATAFNEISRAILGTNAQLKQSSKLLDNMFITFKNTVRYGISSSIFNNVANSIQKAYDYSIKLDTSLNNIRIVTDKSAESMAQFAEDANTAAKELGASTLDYTNAALIYYQQGLSDEETRARAETTVKTANVTGQTGAEVSELLTAVWNGYKVSAEETELYVDKLAAVAATTAADLEELSSGMSKVAAAANAMGVDFDDLNAQIATIVSVTRQAPESVGTALKTIYARIGDLKVDGVDEFGVSLGEVSGKLATMGVQILDQNGEMRDMTSIMTEVAEKWNDWTRAQQQAAAVAIAGKRQYNNLIALFENWDMYTNALETSADAMGTLQHQNDIYMESTAAKLKVLKATWQDLYKGVINEDELNVGIEGLTNAVQVLDNFMDSFGGGIKAISAFGAVLANVFDKQIANSINNAIQRQEVFKNNLALAQAQSEMMKAGTLTPGVDATPKQQAEAAAAEAELEYAKQIYNVRTALNQEQAKELIDRQKAIGQLEEEAVLTEKITQKRESSILGLEKVNTLLFGSEEELDQINAEYARQEDILKDSIGFHKEQFTLLNKAKKEVHAQFTAYEDIAKIKENILNRTSALEEKDYNLVASSLKQLSSKEDIAKVENDILNILESAARAHDDILAGETREQEKLLEQEASMNRALEARVKISSARESQDNTKQIADGMIQIAQSGTNVVQTVTTITSALGSMAMAWSSINSLFQTWGDESASIGDKLTQTFMTLGFTIPMVVANFKKLNDIFGITNSLSILFSKNKAKEAAMTALSSTQQEIENRLLQKYAKLKGISVGEISASMKAKIADAAATKTEAMATQQAVAWQERLNMAMAANPIGLIITALTALVAVLAAVHAHYEKVRQAAHEAAEASMEQASKTRSEVESHAELIEQFEELKDQYEAGEIAKEDLWDTTNKLIDAYGLEGSRLDMLTGQYEKVTAAIRAKQKAEQEELIKEDEQAVKDSGKAVIEEARKVGGSWLSGDQYKINLDSGLMNSPGDYKGAIEAANEIFGEGTAFQDEYGEGHIGTISFDANDMSSLTEYIGKLEQWRDTLKELGYEGAPAYQSIENIINAFNDEGSLDTFKENQEKTLQDIINNSGLNLARTQEEFNQGIQDLQDQLKDGLTKGIIPSETDIDAAIADYIATLNTSLADEFTIQQGLKEKFGNSLNQELVNEFMQMNPDTRLKIVDLFDFSMDETKGHDLLEQYRTFFENEMQSMQGIPATFQMQLNESILKGKDISKSDWESVLASNSNAEEILGDRESFNNKSIGERIALMEQLNEVTRENNRLAIENYDETKEASEAIIENLQEQINLKELNLKGLEEQRTDVSLTLSEEDKDKLEEDIEEIQSEIEELTDKKHEIEIEVDLEDTTDNLLQSMIGDVVTQADQMISATEAIGEGWKVAAENVGLFASAFPDLMNEVQWLEDGSIQLNQDLVNAALEGSQQIIEANKEVVIQSIDDKIAQLTAEKEFQQAKLEALTAYLQAEQDDEAAQKEAIAAIEKAEKDYEQQLLGNQVTDNTNAANAAIANAESAGTGMKQVLSQVNQDIMTLHENFANVFNKNASMKSLSGGSASAGTRASNTFSPTSMANYNGTDAGKLADVQAAKDAMAETEARISEINKEIASYQAAKSDILSRTNKLGEGVDRVKSGKAGKADKGKGGKGGGGSKEKERQQKEGKNLDDELDRYWQINKAIAAVDKSLKYLDKDKKNLANYELIDALRQENELLEKQEQHYQDLLEAQKQEAREKQSLLRGDGVEFDEDGRITNYTDAVTNALNKYNDAVASYNAGVLDEAGLDVAEKLYNGFKKDLDRYDKLYYTEMEETLNKIDDLQRKKLENNLKAWQVEVDLKLNLKELERGWNDFLKEISQDFKKVYKDFREDMEVIKKNTDSYLGEKGTIQTDLNAIKDVTAEIDKINAGQGSNMFESVSQAQEKLKELDKQLQDDAKDMHDLWKDAWDTYLDGIDEVADGFDDLSDQFEHINDELNFQSQLIELLYGDEAYKMMTDLFKGQEQSAMNQIQSLKAQKDMWEELWRESGATMENQSTWTEDQKKYYDEWQDAQGELNDLVLEYIELLKNDYLNTVHDVLQELESAITGSSLDRLNTQWERISANAEKYYDNVEGAYEIQNFANKIDKDIASTKELKNQQKLQKFRDKEIDFLREKEHLTQYDLDAAEARYQVLLKEMALEDAQNNKTSMKLTRNEQGNWSYQYVADEDDMASKQEELLNAYKDLYQLASDAYESNLEALQELQQKYLDSALEIYENENLAEEEKEARLLELREWYFQQYALLAEENTQYRDDLALASSALLQEIYRQDQENYQYMTDAERALLDELLAAHIDGFMDLEERLKANYQNIGDQARAVMMETREDWLSGAQQIADSWNADDGVSVKSQVMSAYEQINVANNNYKEMVHQCAEAVERDFGPQGIKGAIDNAANATDGVRDKTYQLVEQSIPYLNTLAGYVNQVAQAWVGVQQQIANAISMLQQYINAMNMAWAASTPKASVNAGASTRTATSNKNSNNNASNSSNSGSPNGTRGGGSGNGGITGGYDEKGVALNTSFVQNLSADDIKRLSSGANGYTFFASGGYTGSWGSSGKLAVLHEKELVLNAEDTANMLEAVKAVRDISAFSQSIKGSVASSIAGMMGSISNHYANAGSTTNTNTDNVFNITAEFPNAANVDEIREAILTLPNIASQYIGRQVI